MLEDEPSGCRDCYLDGGNRRIPCPLNGDVLCIAGIVLLRQRSEHPTLRSPDVPILAEIQQRGEEHTPRKIWHGVSDITALSDTRRRMLLSFCLKVAVYVTITSCFSGGATDIQGSCWSQDWCACGVIAHAMPSAGSVFFLLLKRTQLRNALFMRR